LAPPITPDITTSEGILSAGIRYQLPLFQGFAHQNAIALAHLAVKAGEIDYALKREELIYTIKSLYYQGLGLHQHKEALQTHLQALQTLRERVEREIALGKRAPLELLKVKSQLAQLRARLEEVSNGIEQVKTRLHALTATSIDGFEPAQEEERQIQGKPLVLQKLDLHLAQRAKEVQKAKSAIYPHLFFEASYLGNFAKGEGARLWQGGVRMRYTLWDFGYAQERIQEAKIQRAAAIHQAKAQRALLQAKIEGTKLQIASLREEVAALKVQLDLARRIEEIEALKYEHGRSTIDDYLQAVAKTKGVQAQLAQKRSQLSTQIAYLNYLKAVR
ncbi:MAG: hypothetical protein C6I00_06590, partial [Nitratiruptor sp.]|nr:hypothetical protein [Nitratiruptor sp.]NPA83111.1 TolC family protein [Campylobacterota bacterium]